jgi:hypothetical protein
MGVLVGQDGLGFRLAEGIGVLDGGGLVRGDQQPLQLRQAASSQLYIT